MTKNKDIIVFLTDQQRWDTLGCYGQKLNVTPNIDRLAKEGTLFEYAFSCQPVCGPARSCIQTGQYATETGCFKNNVSLPQNIQTIAKFLKNKGYKTAYIGKWHLASDENDLFIEKPVPYSRRGGYDYWMASDVLELTSDGHGGGYVFDHNNNRIDFKGYRADAIGDFALDYLKKHMVENQNAPYFLFVSWIEPHHQNNIDKFQGPDYSKNMFGMYEPPGDLIKGAGNWEQNYADYLGACHSIDKNAGKIIDWLKQNNRLDNTLILFTSDHGCHFKTRNWEYKRTCHDSSIRIPLVAWGGEFFGRGSCKELCGLIDIAPTILYAAGCEIPEYMRGITLQQIVKNSIDRQALFIQMSETQVGRAIRTKKWKYSICDPGKDGFRYSYSEKYFESHLYDLENDPHELNNLITDRNYAAIKKDLRNIILQFIKEVEKYEPEIVKAEDAF